MPSTVIQIWQREYEKAHKIPDITFGKRDAVILNQTRKLLKSDQQAEWLIIQFHRIRKDDWITEQGYSAAAFKARLRGLLLAWVKQVGEPEIARQKAAREADFDALLEDPKVTSLLDRIGKPTG